MFNNATTSTQSHLDFEDIKEDLLICKNGQVTMILETTAVNFDLLSDKEQESKILAFSALINSLSFYVQILVRTEKTDISKYIELLNKELTKVTDKNLEKQMETYISFVKNLTFTTDVLEKRFFISFTSSSAAAKRTGLIKQLLGKEDKITNINNLIEASKPILNAKRDFLVKALQRMGVYARQLSTDEIIKLFYASYNPDTQGLQKLQIKYSDINTMITHSSNQS